MFVPLSVSFHFSRLILPLPRFKLTKGHGYSTDPHADACFFLIMALGDNKWSLSGVNNDILHLNACICIKMYVSYKTAEVVHISEHLSWLLRAAQARNTKTEVLIDLS